MKTSFFSNEYKKYILLFPLSVLIGAVYVNLTEPLVFNYSGSFTLKNVFSYLFKVRTGHLFMLFLMCFSTLKDKLFFAFIGYIGLCFGIIQTSLLMQYGLIGLIVFVVLFCLHNLIYCLSTIALYFFSERKEYKFISVDAFVILMGYLLGFVCEMMISWKIIWVIINK